MNIRKAIADFILFHEVGKSSKYTIRNYRRNLGFFVNWVETQHNVYDTYELQLMHLRGYVGYLQKSTDKDGKPFRDTTIHHYSAAVQIFCHWLEHEGIIEKSITTRFSLPKMEQIHTDIYT